MSTPSTKEQIVSEAGVSHDRLRALLKKMMEIGLAWICGWDNYRITPGEPAAIYAYGIDQPNRKRPTARSGTKAYARQRNQMRARRLTHADLVFLTAGRPPPQRTQQRAATP